MAVDQLPTSVPHVTVATQVVDDSVASPRWWPIALLGITLLGAAVRFAALGAKTVWLDEAFSLWMARHNLFDLFDWLIRIDHHPPLYYALLHSWIGWFGDGPNALRSLSALASTLAIPFFAQAAYRLTSTQLGRAGEQVALVAALLLAIAPFHVRYAQETRMYALLTLTVAILFFATTQLLTSHRNASKKRWLWLLLIVAEAAAMLIHNTATVLVPVALNAAIGLLWLAQRRRWLTNSFAALDERHFLRSWIFSQVGALLLWSPWAWGFVRQAQVIDADFWMLPPTTRTVYRTVGDLTYAYPPGWWPWRLVWTLYAMGVAFVGIWRWGIRSAVTWFLLIFCLLPPSVELLVSLRRPLFYDRTLIWTTLPYLMLLARGLVPQRGLQWRNAIWLALFLVLCTRGLITYYERPKEDWDKAAKYVAEHAQPQDLILFHASWAELPFEYNYPDDAPRLIQHGVPADLFDAGAVEPPMTAAASERVRQLVKDKAQVWLLYSHGWYTDPEGLLLKVLDEELERGETQEWAGIQVVRYMRR